MGYMKTFLTMDESPFLARLRLCQLKDICDQLVDYGLLYMPSLFHCQTRTLCGQLEVYLI